MNSLILQGDTAADRNQFLKNLLKIGTYEITFTKVNGDVRIMPCTLDITKLPPPTIKDHTSDGGKIEKPDTLRVWCVDKQEWRSFRVMSVTNIKESDYGN